VKKERNRRRVREVRGTPIAEALPGSKLSRWGVEIRGKKGGEWKDRRIKGNGRGLQKARVSGGGV